MNEQLNDILRRLEVRTHQLLEQRNELQQQVGQLQHVIDQLQEENTTLQQQKKELGEQYAHLKMAKYIDMADTDVKDLRGRIRQMVRDIDRCIAMLKAEN